MDDAIDVVVETPAGSRNKYEHDVDIGAFRLDRRLASATVFPADYGFVPDTLGADGDALDALVLAEEPTFPGCVIRVRVDRRLRGPAVGSRGVARRPGPRPERCPLAWADTASDAGRARR